MLVLSCNIVIVSNFQNKQFVVNLTKIKHGQTLGKQKYKVWKRLVKYYLFEKCIKKCIYTKKRLC